MSEELMQSTADANTESSSATPESTASSSEQTSGAQASEAQSSKESSQPFHEHPRFKELVDERNQWKQQFSEMQERLAKYEQQVEASKPKELSPEMKMIEELKGIRPEFGQLIENMMNKLSKVEQLESGWNQQQAEQTRHAVETQLSQLHEQAKVPNELRETYRLHIQAMANANPKLGLQDLPKLHKQVHDQYSKILDGIKRAERESYLKDKKADTAIPQSAPKSPTVKPSQKKPQFSNNPEEARKQLIGNIMQSIRAQESGS